MRIYTRTGDKGQTSLASGKRVPKYHERLEAYGTVDELNSVTGLVRSLVVDKQLLNMLHKIQNSLFTISSDLAMDDEAMKKNVSKIDSSDIIELEKDMDRMLDLLPTLKSFILPGGNQAVATCHVART
ncbi:MAG: cob(I)yrinic acid a,c-diamide adenosyltransferase, partial [Bacteroidales bacterium]|nr:cob(I)yrinic acid a,c-diamide adenosyltransferase [Bacteroidales bacterium]